MPGEHRPLHACIFMLHTKTYLKKMLVFTLLEMIGKW